jgi:hypothetical protein
MIPIENKIPFAAATTAATTPVCSFCSKPGHYIHNCNDILIEDITKKETQKSKRREKLLKQITLANDNNDMMRCSKNLKLR